jgi:hypothetical protein
MSREYDFCFFIDLHVVIPFSFYDLSIFSVFVCVEG